MKPNYSILTMTMIAFLMAIVSASAQYDDVYYDPSKDGGTSVSEVQTEPTKPADNNYNNQQPDGTNDKYFDNDEEYDDYDYYYSSRIRRFNRPMRGFDYFDDCYVSSYNYDPFWSGTTIYVGFDSYWDYNRWRRWNSWNYGPSFGYGFGFGPSFGWNYGYNNYYSPWSCYSYNPYPPFGNVYYNNYYYGDYGYGGGWYNGGGYNNGNNNYYGNTVYYGPRKGGGSLTELKGNPRGFTHSTPSNPRGFTNQTPGVSHTNGRNTNTSLPNGVQNTNPRGNKDVLIDRKPGETVKPSTNTRPQTQSTRPSGRDNTNDRPQNVPPSTRKNDRPQVESPKPGRDNSTSPSPNQRPANEEKIMRKDNSAVDNTKAEREARRENRLRQIYDSGERPSRRESGVNERPNVPSRSYEPGQNRTRKMERSPENYNSEQRQNRNSDRAPQINRSENGGNSGNVRSSGENTSRSSEKSSSSPSPNGRSGRK